MRVGIKAVVEDSKLCESRHQLNQMDATPIVALPNLFFRDVVSASSHPGSNPRHVQFGTTQSHEPHAHVDSSHQRFVQKSADGVPAKGRFAKQSNTGSHCGGSIATSFSIVVGGADRLVSSGTASHS